MGNEPTQSESPEPNNAREGSELHPQEINLASQGASLPPTMGSNRTPEEAIIADLVCSKTVLSRDEEDALNEFRDAVAATLGVSADDDFGQSSLRVRYAEPQRSELAEIIDKIDAVSGDGKQAVVPDLVTVLVKCDSTSRPSPALREPEIFNLSDGAPSKEIFVFGRYDGALDRWRVGVGLSPKLLEQAVENFIKSVDDDQQKPGTGAFSCIRFLVDEVLELELRRICRSAGLRGNDQSDTVYSLLSEGLGAVLRPDYEVKWSDDLRSACFKVTALMPSPPPAPISAEAPHLREFSVRVELNRCQELSVSIEGRRDLGLASMY